VLAGATLVAATLATGAGAMEPSEELYLRHCGACHGPGGRGDGIAATLMTPRPPDLTTIAERNGGTFPMGAVLTKMDGSQAVPAHGTREMPIWGERFEAEASDPASRHAEAHGKLLLIAEYVRSIQR
jgi:mono/diheme cytochrome c family protein